MKNINTTNKDKDYVKQTNEEKPYTEEVNLESTVDLLEVIELFLCKGCIQV